MAYETLKAPHRGNGGDLREVQSWQAGNPEINAAALQAQYLTRAFSLPGETAAVVAYLAFGGGK